MLITGLVPRAVRNRPENHKTQACFLRFWLLKLPGTEPEIIKNNMFSEFWPPRAARGRAKIIKTKQVLLVFCGVGLPETHLRAFKQACLLSCWLLGAHDARYGAKHH